MKPKKIKVISINEFLDIEFKFCFVCGVKKYNQFYFNDHLYRVCNLCLKKKIVMEFFGQNKNSCRNYKGSDSKLPSDSKVVIVKLYYH